MEQGKKLREWRESESRKKSREKLFVAITNDSSPNSKIVGDLNERDKVATPEWKKATYKDPFKD